MSARAAAAADYRPPQRGLTPVLDLAPWRDGSDRAGVARQFDRICREIGFFYLRGHGLPQQRMDALLAAAARFFALPESSKRALTVDRSRRGYEPFGLQALDATAPADLKESLLIGLGQEAGHPCVRRGLANYGPNRWPDAPGMEDFRWVCEAWFADLMRLGETLMAVFATVAGLPEDHFAPLLVDPMATLRLIHYPPQPGPVRNRQLGCGEHTDWGAVTLLLQDATGGLEIRAADGEWLYADPLPGTLLINLGDMMPVWTNGAYQSNPHRVRNRHPEHHRYSAALFIDPFYDARVACLDAFRVAGEAPRFAPRTVGEHIDAMYARSYGQAVHTEDS